MSLDEAARHRLHTTLEGVLGSEPASDLMSLLPPVGWADVATKQDLTVLEQGLRIEIGELRTELRTGLADLRAEMHDSLRKQTIALVGVMATLNGLTWAAVTFGG